MSQSPIAWREVRARLVRDLDTAGIEDAAREVRWLACHVLETDASGLLLRENLTAQELARLEQAVERRCAREPAAFITGDAGFWTLSLAVSRETLIPRADSEALIEALLQMRPDRASVRSVLDLGTGTGCLLLAALSEYQEAIGIGVDLSPDAAVLAMRNARANGLDKRCACFAGSWDTALDARFDVVLSNPPYIPRADLAGLMPEVRQYEPGRALDGGVDGLDAYRVIVSRLPDLLVPGGCAILEMGIGQIDQVSALARGQGLAERGRWQDLGGIARALVLEAPDA